VLGGGPITSGVGQHVASPDPLGQRSGWPAMGGGAVPEGPGPGHRCREPSCSGHVGNPDPLRWGSRALIIGAGLHTRLVALLGRPNHWAKIDHH
jgi:hypothetical protein